MESLTNSSMSSKRIVYKFKTTSIEHFKELHNDIDKLYREGKLSENKTYRNYLSTKKFKVPDEFPSAKYVIILAIFSKLGLVNFCLGGKKHEIMIPPNYYDDGLSFEALENLILKKIIKEPGYKIEFTKNLHLKLLAVRSGLGKYGRNNICYVDKMGSMINLYAYFTDFQFEEDNWTKMRMMDQCKNCKICINNCPTNAIPLPSDDNFVINAGNCISVYNEIRGKFPNWISSDAHNALIGCMRCQLSCPGNREVIKLTEKFEDITEEETRMILEGKLQDQYIESLAKKLRMFTPSNSELILPVLKRNLEVLIF